MDTRHEGVRRTRSRSSRLTRSRSETFQPSPLKTADLRASIASACDALEKVSPTLPSHDFFDVVHASMAECRSERAPAAPSPGSPPPTSPARYSTRSAARGPTHALGSANGLPAHWYTEAFATAAVRALPMFAVLVRHMNEQRFALPSGRFSRNAALSSTSSATGTAFSFSTVSLMVRSWGVAWGVYSNGEGGRRSKLPSSFFFHFAGRLSVRRCEDVAGDGFPSRGKRKSGSRSSVLVLPTLSHMDHYLSRVYVVLSEPASCGAATCCVARAPSLLVTRGGSASFSQTQCLSSPAVWRSTAAARSPPPRRMPKWDQFPRRWAATSS